MTKATADSEHVNDHGTSVHPSFDGDRVERAMASARRAIRAVCTRCDEQVTACAMLFATRAFIEGYSLESAVSRFQAHWALLEQHLANESPTINVVVTKFPIVTIACPRCTTSMHQAAIVNGTELPMESVVVCGICGAICVFVSGQPLRLATAEVMASMPQGERAPVEAISRNRETIWRRQPCPVDAHPRHGACVLRGGHDSRHLGASGEEWA